MIGRRTRRLISLQTTWSKSLSQVLSFFRIRLPQRNRRAMTRGRRTLRIGSIETSGWSYWRAPRSSCYPIPVNLNAISELGYSNTLENRETKPTRSCAKSMLRRLANLKKRSDGPKVLLPASRNSPPVKNFRLRFRLARRCSLPSWAGKPSVCQRSEGRRQQLAELAVRLKRQMMSRVHRSR